MSVINITPPPRARVAGELRDDYDVDELNQDLLQIQLANDITIDVGWYPENDPEGSFVIVAYSGNYLNKLITQKTANVYEAAEKSMYLARVFSRMVSIPPREVNVSNTHI